jgi:hypothetical protein
MDKVSLTYFVDFVMKSGMPKLNIVRDFKERDKYEPFADFYKQAREAIVEAHKGPLPKKSLDRFLLNVKEEKRRKVYPSVIKGHKRFLGNRAVEWFVPPTSAWTVGGVELNVNPELGLIIDDVPHVIKLYFKEGRLVANRVSAIVHLMTVALTSEAPGSVFGLLDVRHSRLHVLKAPNPSLHALLEGEAAAFSAMYTALEGPTRAVKLAKTQPAEGQPQNVVNIPVPYRSPESRALAEA